jgi:tellurite resistance protein TehA-like permease
MGWRNYWGGLVFAPFAIFVGFLLIYVAIFHWRKLRKEPGDRKG